VIGSPIGTIVSTRGGLLVAALAGLAVGAGTRVTTSAGSIVPARVTDVDGDRVTLTPFAGIEGVAAGDRVEADPEALAVPVGSACLGRAIDALGRPLDGRVAITGIRGGGAGGGHAPADRRAISAPFTTGIRAIDGPLTFGVGARIGIFGAPGCGKSTLLEAIVAGSCADVTVVGLVGERGREAQRWLARIDPGMTIVCATGDRSAAERLRAAEVAFAQADALRRRGLDVLLVLDSLARVAAAARDVGVAAGEPVGRGGYPPSVFGVLTGLLERAGSFTTGSITLVATVLSEEAEQRDPVSDACRAALDGHVVLSERLAQQGWFPAIDIPASASRTIADVASAEHLAAARALRSAVAALDNTREARGFGLDPGAGDPAVRRAIAAEEAVAAFLRQSEPADPSATLTELLVLTDRLSNGYSR
jgi:type III secretion protein N (ATPase)